MYLKRKVDAFLCAWKADPERKPLIIKGCRQVGKTESVSSLQKKIMKASSKSILSEMKNTKAFSQMDMRRQLL